MNRQVNSYRGKITRSILAVGTLLAAAILAPGVPGKAPAPTQSRARAATPISTPSKAYGSKGAPITMEVFSDFQCPTCRVLYEQTLRPMIQDYVASGKVYLIHRDFPLPMHAYSHQAARWLNAAAEIGKFGDVEAALYDNQAAWSADGNIEKYVSGAMGPADFKRVQRLMQGCEAQTTASMKPTGLSPAAQANRGCSLDTYIDQDIALGKQVPVQGTPTFIIYHKGQRLAPGSGYVSWPVLKQFFDSLLSQ